MSKRLQDRVMLKNQNANYLLDQNYVDRKKQFNYNIYDRQSPAERKSTDSGLGRYYNSYYQRPIPQRSPDEYKAFTNHQLSKIPSFLNLDKDDKFKRFPQNEIQQPINSFQYFPKQQYSSMYDREQSQKRKFNLNDVVQVQKRQQSPTIFSKKQSLVDVDRTWMFTNQQQHSFFSPKNNEQQPKLLKNASDYISNYRPFTSFEIQNDKNLTKNPSQKFQPYLNNNNNNSKFDIDKLRMELEQYKRNNKSRVGDGILNIKNREVNKDYQNTYIRRDVSPNLNFNYIKPKVDDQNKDVMFNYRQQKQSSPQKQVQSLKASRSELGNPNKKQPFQLINAKNDLQGIVSDNQRYLQDRRKTPETNRVEELRKQLYSTYKPSNRELFFESLNKSTPYNKIANQREQNQQSSNNREKDQIKYKLDKKFI
ncbi:unnamed protein product [Paramecium sonneborni]|uniref:Uncharacterized protein n=1 Tax=Paramecium sonneborni TaxID=65129 RepID=A0A8S1MXJ7_9CILI|nr:unnamed protein product [Paramecium sonneborni]